MRSLLLLSLCLPAVPAAAMGERASKNSISIGNAPGKPGTNMGSGPEAYRDTVGGTRGTDRQADPSMTMTDPKPKTTNAPAGTPDTPGLINSDHIDATGSPGGHSSGHR